MIKVFRRNRKSVSIFLLTVFCAQVVIVQEAFALTSGPTQPEVHAFQPATATNMVDLFSGDFSYNIPLFELPGPNGGYPFNLSYQSGISMDQEASWVGLGWSLQPGAITRQMRGIPDEFDGSNTNGAERDKVITRMSIAPNITVGMGAGGSVEFFGGDASLKLGFGVYKNTYTGTGHTIDAHVGFKKATAGGMTGNVGLGLSVDTNDGATLDASIGLGNRVGEVGMNAGYNGRAGLTNVSLTHGLAGYYKSVSGLDRSMASWSADISFAQPTYTPQINMPMSNSSFSATIKAGGAYAGVFGAPYIRGFYNKQILVDDAKSVETPAFGYMNYEKATENDVQDFNREKDGMISADSPNLPIPSLTYDIYTVSGQGIGMMYRPIRNDIGFIYDKLTLSTSSAIGGGVDVGPTATHLGVNLSLSHSRSASGPWQENNQLSNISQFKQKELQDFYEPWYFKVHGEPSAEVVSRLNNLGGDRAVRPMLTSPEDDPYAMQSLESEGFKTSGNPIGDFEGAGTNTRRSRAHVITSITNAELLNGAEEKIPYFRIYSSDGVKYDRKAMANPGNHFAGHVALSAEGLRYVYALPAYNTMQEEYVFSATGPNTDGRVTVSGTDGSDPTNDMVGTDRFVKRTKVTKFAHSHLLTAILGPDYVDIGDNGVDEADLGYWVKFTYQATSSQTNPYKWRDPFYGAHFNEGWKTEQRDNKGSFTYGEKEIWYLAKAETKTHIAEFIIQPREDGWGAGKIYQNKGEPATLGAKSFSLKEIRLYTRSNPSMPIKVTKFDYSYSLCKGIENSSTGQGKLTLKKVRFEYGGTSKGSLSPYEFAYYNEDVGTEFLYDMNAYDRWGGYKPYPPTDKRYNHDFPYIDQAVSRTELDTRAKAWSLKEITLPSKAKIAVDYEADDYAYVQNKTAMQMVELLNPDPTGSTLFSLNRETEDGNNLNPNYLKIRFKLQKELPATASAAEKDTELLKYIDTDTWQLYFKLFVRLSDPSKNLYEYVSGYAEINQNQSARGLELGANGKFQYGYFFLVGERGGSDLPNDMHPFSLRAWQHIRSNQPMIANGVSLGDSPEPPKNVSTSGEMIGEIESLTSIANAVRQLAQGYNKFCYRKKMGQTIDGSKSRIRLNVASKFKVGGGLRVRQISIYDNWSGDSEGVYGQRYNYTTDEGGNIVSSGVAAYEPMIGGDENALRYAKKYPESVPLHSDNNLYFEYPVNESYYPGPQVGYSKVTVMTLPSAARAGVPISQTDLFPTGVAFGTTGKTVHEFFTAKDFPVIVDETTKLDKQDMVSIPIPLLGHVSVTKLTTTQGYSILTNDMHGKQKQVSTYRQSDDGKFDPEPISWVKYNYVSDERVVQGKRVRVLSNVMQANADKTLELISASNPDDPLKPNVHFNQEVEMFHDMRQFEDKIWEGGARVNTDVLYIPLFAAPVPIPIPTVWPSIGKSTTRLRTAVTNKVIYRGGILESTEAYDGGSLVKTTNIRWDKETGSVVLTSVTNNFDNPVFKYDHLVYREYQGMGPAYQNIGIKFTLEGMQSAPSRPSYYLAYPSQDLSRSPLQKGDELLIYPISASSDLKDPVALMVYIGQEDNYDLFYCETPLSALQYNAMIVRSGFRNHLTVSGGAITGLSKGIADKGSPKSYQKQVTVPAN